MTWSFYASSLSKHFPPGLVRATAINASRAKRSMLTYYQHYYEERSRALEAIIANQRDPTTFEDFVTRVYSPKPLTNIFSSNAGSSSSRPSSLIASSSLGSQALSSALRGNHEGGGSAATSPFAASSAAEQFHMRGRSKTDVGHIIPTGNDEDEGGLGSPRQTRRKVVVAPVNSAKVVANRPLSIKEEPGLPGHNVTSSGAVPLVTRRR